MRSHPRGHRRLWGLSVCLHDLMTALLAQGLEVTEAQIRWAIKTGKVSRPPVDGSLRFDYGEQHVREILAHFGVAARESSTGPAGSRPGHPAGS